MTDPLQLARECGGIDMLRYTGEPSGIIEMRAESLSILIDRVRAEAMREQRALTLDEYDALILADGYSGGCCITDEGSKTVMLHYKTREQAEAAFDVVTTAIDAAIAQQEQEGTNADPT